MNKKIIGIDIGGTKCAVITGNSKGEILDKESFPTTTVDETLNKLYALAEKAIDKAENPIFGISCGSPLDSKTGRILSPPNLPGWDNIHITKELTTRFGGEAYLMNDANACAIAEWMFGASKGYENVIFLTHATGNGAGLILNGRLYEGTSGDAGEIGHIRLTDDGPWGYGKNGSFEGWSSGGGIAKLAQQYAKELDGKVAFNPGKIEDISAKDVGDAAENGDKLAINIYNESSYYLGRGLAILIDLFNPEIIVLGTIYSKSQNIIDTKMYEALKKECLPHTLNKCKIVPIKLGKNIGDYGAISVALYNTNII